MKRKLYFYICVVICCCFALSNISIVEGGVEEYIPSTTCEEKTVHEYYFNSELGVNIEEKSCEGKNSKDEDKGIFDKILDSAVLVGIITALFNWRQHNNTNSLKYITEERQKWREKIRDIAKNIEAYQYSSDDKDKQKLKEILVELKVNINPYGKEKDTAYMEDGHIWAVIRKLEKVNNEKEFLKAKNKLIDYLFYLLKYDWERAKYEVEKKAQKLKLYSFLIILMVLIGGAYGFCIQKEICDISYLILFVIIVELILFVYCCWEEKSSELKKRIKELVGTGMIAFLVAVLSVRYYFILIRDSEQNNWENMDYVLIIIFIIVVIIYFVNIFLDYINDKEGNKKIYKEIIKKRKTDKK